MIIAPNNSVYYSCSSSVVNSLYKLHMNKSKLHQTSVLEEKGDIV